MCVSIKLPLSIYDFSSKNVMLYIFFYNLLYNPLFCLYICLNCITLFRNFAYLSNYLYFDLLFSLYKYIIHRVLMIYMSHCY